MDNNSINIANETSGEALAATPHREESWFIKGVRAIFYFYSMLFYIQRFGLSQWKYMGFINLSIYQG